MYTLKLQRMQQLVDQLLKDGTPVEELFDVILDSKELRSRLQHENTGYLYSQTIVVGQVEDKAKLFKVNFEIEEGPL